MVKKATAKKLTLDEMIAQMDDAKKANPLDLSSDQDLSIALMNLTSLEEHFFFSGGKTGKTGFYDLINVVREMRKDLMDRIVKKSGGDNGEVWCISKHLLAASMRLMEVGTKALGRGNKEDAYSMFNKAYELYSLFWGVNMDLIDLDGVKHATNTISEEVKVISDTIGCACDADSGGAGKPEAAAKTTASSKPAVVADAGSKSVVGKLGAWVKKAVDCCIE
ncbi:MAG: hypothetical protein FWD33_01770 [Alphaproteobacteria bacterium]|nr:hypothetical protein [Alphaproteobacteria bacterium]